MKYGRMDFLREASIWTSCVGCALIGAAIGGLAASYPDFGAINLLNITNPITMFAIGLPILVIGTLVFFRIRKIEKQKIEDKRLAIDNLC